MSAALSVSLTEQLLPLLRHAAAQNQILRPPVIWLELGSCTGNSISLDNAVNPSWQQFLTEIIDLRYHWTFNAAQGDAAAQLILDTARQAAGNYWLIVEGAVMTAAQGTYNYVFRQNGELVTGLAALQNLAPHARYIIAVGDCACFGGPAAAHPNPGGAKGVGAVVSQPVINIAGCPAHPDWLTGTVSHLLLYGLPQLDAYHRPTMFFGRTIHELCQRRQQFEDGIFAAFPGDDGCLYRVGCKGPVTYSDCPLRQWNHYVNWPVRAGMPCIGCTNPSFPDGMMPYYEHLPDVHIGGAVANVKKIGAALAAVGVGAVGTHLGMSIYKRRVHQHLLTGTKPSDPAPPETLTQLKQELDDLIRQQNALLAETSKLERRQRLQRRRTWRQRLRDFWRSPPDSGDGR